MELTLSELPFGWCDTNGCSACAEHVLLTWSADNLGFSRGKDGVPQRTSHSEDINAMSAGFHNAQANQPGNGKAASLLVWPGLESTGQPTGESHDCTDV